MTLLVTSIEVDKLAELEVCAEAAWAGGAEAVEVRIDTLEGDPADLAAYLNRHRRRTWIVTCRSAAEGGHFAGDTMGRVARLIAVARGMGAYVDFEWADWQRSANIQQKVRLAAAGPDEARRLILSAHHLAGPPPDLAASVDQVLRTRDLASAKMAYAADDIGDSFAALDLMRQYRGSIIAICLGEAGMWTRVLAKKLGAFASYCCLTPDAATAPGQIRLGDMVGRYRWATLNTDTRVFGVVGDPIAHSMSPMLFNRWFAEAGVNAVYLPLRVRRHDDSLPRFLDACMYRPWLDIGGFSVTLPHKAAALDWLGDRADRTAHLIGAVNTLVVRHGTWAGYNTDCHAALASLIDALGCARSDLAGLSVDVLGTGGAAKAVLSGLRDFGCRVTLYGRSRAIVTDLAHRFACRATAWEDRAERTGQVLINCTNLGMRPDEGISPMPGDALGGCRLVFDLIYNPLETKLLRDAAAAGCKTLSGLDMFLRQAAVQFELWTETTPDVEQARGWVTAELRRQGGTFG